MKEHPEYNEPEQTNEEEDCDLCALRHTTTPEPGAPVPRTRNLNERWVKTSADEIHNLNVVDARIMFHRYAGQPYVDVDYPEHVPPQGTPWSVKSDDLPSPVWDRLDPSSENDDQWIISNREAQTFMARDFMYAINDAYERISHELFDPERYFAPTGKVLNHKDEIGGIFDRLPDMRFILGTLYANAMTTLHHAALFKCANRCNGFDWDTDCEFCYPEVAYDGLPFTTADEEVQWSQVSEEYETGITPVVTDCACNCDSGRHKKTNTRQKVDEFFAVHWDNGEGEEQ